MWSWVFCITFFSNQFVCLTKSKTVWVHCMHVSVFTLGCRCCKCKNDCPLKLRVTVSFCPVVCVSAGVIDSHFPGCLLVSSGCDFKIDIRMHRAIHSRPYSISQSEPALQCERIPSGPYGGWWQMCAFLPRVTINTIGWWEWGRERRELCFQKSFPCDT